MQVTCESCNKTLNIPDEKVPKDKAFNLTCPGCKNKIRVDQHLKPAEAESEPEIAAPAMPDALGGEQAAEEEEGNGADTLLQFSDSFDEDDAPPIYEEGDKVALILDQKNYDEWEKVLENLNYKLETASSPEHGVHKLKFYQYDVVVFHKNFGGVELEDNAFYQYILTMPMTTRRKTFIAMIGDDLRSTDNLQAYAMSVNLVINEKDLDKLEIIARKGINDNDMFYRVFKETMQKLGKV